MIDKCNLWNCRVPPGPGICPEMSRYEAEPTLHTLDMYFNTVNTALLKDSAPTQAAE